MIKNPRIKSIGIGHSFFEFISDYCLDEKYHGQVNRAFHRLCTLMRKMNVKTAVIEDINNDYSDIKEECLALKTYYGIDIEIIAFRFTFVSEEAASLKALSSAKADSFLSSAIVINFKKPDGTWRSYLYSAIVTIPKISGHEKFGTVPLLNNYLHIFKTFQCDVSIADGELFRFNITGTFFGQQNGVTSVCAHASLCMTINNMQLPGVGMISPESINKIIGVDHKTVKFSPPREGLSKEEILLVLEKNGLQITWSDFFENPNIEYNEYIYRYIESKCPVLLVFATAGTSAQHIVPILGHTLNSDMWRPEAEPAYVPAQRNRLNYKSASAWVDHFIMHDDNFGMYFCLPVDALKRVTLPKYDPSFRAHFAVVVIPSGVSTPAWEAEWASIVIVKHILNLSKATLDVWSARILNSDSAGRPVVVRTLLVNKDEYKKNLGRKDFADNDFTAADQEELVKDLPDIFWLSEISLPDLYAANKSKVIEFFYKCDCPQLPNDDDINNRWLQIRFPYVLLKKSSAGAVSVFAMSVKSHYPLLRLEREHDVMDW